MRRDLFTVQNAQKFIFQLQDKHDTFDKFDWLELITELFYL